MTPIRLSEHSRRLRALLATWLLLVTWCLGIPLPAQALGETYAVALSLTSPANGVITAVPATVAYRLSITNTGTGTGNVVPAWTPPSGMSWSVVSGSSVVRVDGSVVDTTTNPTGTQWKPVTGYSLAAGKTLDLDFQATVAGSTPTGQYPTIGGASSVGGLFPAATVGTAGLTVTAPVAMDVSISPSARTTTPGSTVTYTVTVANNSQSPASARSLALTMSQPAFTYTGGLTTTWSRGGSPGSIGTYPNFDLSTMSPMAPGEWLKIRYTMTVPLATAAGSYPISAALTGTNIMPFNTEWVHPVAVTSARSGTASISVSPTSLPASGGSATYTVQVTNTSTGTISGVVFQADVPSGFGTPTSSQTSPNGSSWTATGAPTAIGGATDIAGTTYQWSPGLSVAAGASLYLRYTVSVPAMTGSTNAVARFGGTNLGGFTESPLGGSLAVGVTGTAVTIAQGLSPATIPAAGSPATYTITLTNTSLTQAASGINLSALLPGGLGLVPGSASLSLTNTGTISTVISGTSGPGTSVPLNSADYVCTDTADNLYIADDQNHRVVKLTAATGIASVIAGTGTAGSTGDGGPATSATLNRPKGVAVDTAGNVYIAEDNGNRIRKVAAGTGIITTYAGTGTAGFSGDSGPAASARINSPRGLVVDNSNNLLLCDASNNRIRCVANSTATFYGVPMTAGNIYTVVGNGTAGFAGDGGAATSARINDPRGVDVSPTTGDIYIADTGNERVRKVDAATRLITTFAGTGTAGFSGDGGAATSARLNDVRDVRVGNAGTTVYIADRNNERIRKVVGGTITTVTGTGTGGYNGDGIAATTAQLNNPRGLAVDSAGNYYIIDSDNQRLRKVTVATGLISTVVGTGTAGYSLLNYPSGVGAIDGFGAYYFTSRSTHQVYQVAADGTTSLVAGTGTSGNTGDGGPATSARFNNPTDVTVDRYGNFYIADRSNHKIRKVATDGTVSTFAGTGTAGNTGDGGAATSARLNNPSGLAMGPDGTLYIADQSNHKIRKVAPSGTISTYAGTGTSGNTGDGGAATSARLNQPYRVAFDQSGNLFIADQGNNKIRMVTPAGVISTYAGTGTAGSTGDGGAATAARLSAPGGIGFDAVDNLYIADTNNDRIRKVTKATGIITTVTGTGSGGYSGDGGAATAAQINGPEGVFFDDLIIMDGVNDVVRQANLPTSGDVVDPPASTKLDWTNLGSIPPGQTLTFTFQLAADGATPAGTYYVQTTVTGGNVAAATTGPPVGSGGSTPALTVTNASAVTLTKLSATATPTGVTVAWQATRETSHQGYAVYRAPAADATPVCLTPDLVGGPGERRQVRDYSVADDDVQVGETYVYWLDDLDRSGQRTRHGPVMVTIPVQGTVTASWTPPAVQADSQAPSSRGSADPAQQTKTGRGYLQNVVADAEGVSFDLVTPPLTATEYESYTRVSIPGLPSRQDNGQVEVPVAVAAVGLPPHAGFHAEIVSADDAYRLTNIILPILSDDWTWTVPTPAPSKAPDQAPPRQPAPVPAAPVLQPAVLAPLPGPAGDSALHPTQLAQGMQFAFGVMATDGQMPRPWLDSTVSLRLRDLDLTRLQLYPVVYDAESRTVIQYRRVRVRLTLDQPATLVTTSPEATAAKPAFERVLDQFADDQGLLCRWQGTAAAADADPALPAGGVRLTVTRPGLQRIAAARLAAAGLDLSQPDRLQLFHRNQQVPMHLTVTDGALDSLTFHAAEAGSRYADRSYYDVVVGDGPGERLPTFAADPGAGTAADAIATVTDRAKTLYVGNAPAHPGSDHWFADYLFRNHPEVTRHLQVQGRLTGPVTLRLAMASTVRGSAGPIDNRVTVAVNGTAVGDMAWPGADYQTATFDVDPALVHDGNNAVTLTMADANDAIMYLESVALDYRTAWTVGPEPLAVAATGDWVVTATTPRPADVYRLAADGTVAVGEGVAIQGQQLQFRDPDPTPGHRYAVLADADNSLHVAARPTPDIDLRRGDLQADHLIVAPAALRDEAERLAAHRTAQGLRSLVVPLEAVYEGFAGGETDPAAIRDFLRWTLDHWQAPKPSYVVLFGNGTYDGLDLTGNHDPNPIPPLMTDTRSVGEVPNDNGLVCLDERQAIPSFFIGRLPVKTAAQARSVVDKLIAYDGATGPWLADAVGVADNKDAIFARMVTDATQQLPGFTWQTFGVANALAMQTRLRQGSGLTVYVGHGSDWGWTQESLFDGDQLDTWSANGQAGIVVAATCLNAYFASPWYPGLGEAMVLKEQAGAVAFWGSVGYTLPANQPTLLADLFRYVQQPACDVGMATTLAKLGLFLRGDPMWEDELANWVLLGDPATRLHR